jgi:hypothetical protein
MIFSMNYLALAATYNGDNNVEAGNNFSIQNYYWPVQYENVLMSLFFFLSEYALHNLWVHDLSSLGEQ